MKIVKSFLMCLGMFTIFPVPKNSWNNKYMHLITANMVVAGAVIGNCWYVAAVFLSYVVSNKPLLSGAAIALVPFILSGFLHVDGYMDTADAIFSRRELEKKREILKDSHVGAFAVIAFVCLALLQVCAMCTILMEQKELYALVFIPVMSRGVSGISLLELKSMSKEGFGASFKTGTNKKHTSFIIMFMAACLFAAYAFFGFIAFMPLLAAIAGGVCVSYYVYVQMDGISGDLCGCIITASELCGLLMLALI